MPGHQCIAADQHPVDQKRAVATGVARCRDRQWPAGQFSGHLGGQRLRGGDALAAEPAVAHEVSGPQRPPGPPDAHRDVDRRCLLQILALGVADLVGVTVDRGAMGFGEPDRRTEVVDVGVRQQDGPPVFGLVPELPQRGQHVVAVTGVSGVDQHDAAVVGDQRPVHRPALDEVDGLGDGIQHRCHAPESRHRAIASSAKPGAAGRPPTRGSRNDSVAELKLGYKASAEQFAPRELVELAVAAEGHGMDSATVSDHFQPWRHEGGHAPFSLAWMTAVGERTKRITLGTSVLTPTFRYNPAVVAQAFATMACLYPDRIFLGVGTGEALNEIATGYQGDWPEFKERFARLREAGRLMGGLWRGDRVDFNGDYYRLKGASIYDVPEGGVPIYVAAGGPAVAKYAGRAGDGFICTSGKGEELYKDKLIPAVKEGAAAADRNVDDIDKMIEIKISYDPDPKLALENTRFWAPLSLTAEQKHSIDDPIEMEKAADALPIEQVAKRWIVASDPDEAVEKVGQYVTWGLNHLVFHAPGHDQRRFLELFEKDLAPRLRRLG